MTGFLLRRFVSLCLTLLAAALAVFLILEVIPGDPAQLMLGVEARP
ncbi:MAG: ABC transporter permease, partial [Pannonibacter indicus]